MSTNDPLLDFILESRRLGKRARFSLLDRSENRALASMVASAEEEVGSSQRIVWVDNGRYALFALPGVQPATAVISDRAIEYAHRIRSALVPQYRRTLTFRQSKRQISVARTSAHLFLTLAAEQALQEGHVELATKLLAVTPTDSVPRSSQKAETVGTQDGRPSLAFLAATGFGILHELGHLAPDWKCGDLAEDEKLLELLDWTSRNWMKPHETVGDASIRAQTMPESVVGLNKLKSEVHADLFATATLLRTARACQHDLDREDSWTEFIREVHAAQQVAVVAARLQGAVKLGTASDPKPNDARELAFQPQAVAVRNLAQQELLVVERLVADCAASGRRADRRAVDRQRQFVRNCFRPLAAHYQTLDASLNSTIDFVLNRQRDVADVAVLDRFTAEARVSGDYSRMVDQFLVIADSLGLSTPVTSALRELVDDFNRRSE